MNIERFYIANENSHAIHDSSGGWVRYADHHAEMLKHRELLDFIREATFLDNGWKVIRERLEQGPSTLNPEAQP